jgi:class 3 adenylate cyclase
VKNLGDGVMVVFQSVTSGLRCAVEMQQSIETRNRSREPLLARVGVSMGETDVEGGDLFGIPVVEAARCAALTSAEPATVPGDKGSRYPRRRLHGRNIELAAVVRLCGSRRIKG